MLTHPTVDKLHELRCTGMAKAMAEQLASPQVQNLSFEERLGLLVDRELTERHSRQLTNRLRRARLRHDACIEDIDFRAPRGLDKDLVLSLADGRWVREHLSILIIGPAGIGKSWIACALAHSACRLGHSASYRCCFSHSLVGSPQELTALFRRRISWDDEAIREPIGAGGVAVAMNRCCRSGEDVGARAPSVGKGWASVLYLSRPCPHAP